MGLNRFLIAASFALLLSQISAARADSCSDMRAAVQEVMNLSDAVYQQANKDAACEVAKKFLNSAAFLEGTFDPACLSAEQLEDARKGAENMVESAQYAVAAYCKKF
jgi:hypothetical protein